MSKNKYVNLPRSVRVDERIHEHLQLMADRERRSITNLIGVIIEEAVEADMREEPYASSSQVIRGDV